MVTHFHGDHTGSVAEIRAWSDAPVIAHALDAPIIRGEAPSPQPVLEEWERPLFERVGGGDNLAGPPARIDREVEDGDTLDFGGEVIWIPGHTGGSIAIYLPEERVLFTGDTVASTEGRVMLGVFNQDRARAVASFRRLAELDVEVACFGHGDPVLTGASERLREAAAKLDR